VKGETRRYKGFGEDVYHYIYGGIVDTETFKDRGIANNESRYCIQYEKEKGKLMKEMKFSRANKTSIGRG